LTAPIALLGVFFALFVVTVFRFARMTDTTIVPAVQRLCAHTKLPQTIGFAMDIDTTDGAFWETFRLAQYAAAPTAIDFTQPHDTLLVILRKPNMPKNIHPAMRLDTLAVTRCNAQIGYLVCRK
jgi:hypothetical protein